MRDSNSRGLTGLLAMALMLAASGPTFAVPPVEGGAKLTTARWLEPGPDHVIEPYGMITEIGNGGAVTKLPPPDEVRALTLILEVSFDTTPGTNMPLRFDSRSGMLDIEIPKELANDVIAPSAISGTTATIRFKVTVDPLKLKQLQPVYYEVVSLYAPGTPTRGVAWTFKPWGKHDEKRPVRRPAPALPSP